MKGLYYSEKGRVMCWVDMDSLLIENNHEAKERFLLHFLGLPKQTKVVSRKIKISKPNSRFKGFTYYQINDAEINYSAFDIGDWTMTEWLNC